MEHGKEVPFETPVLKVSSLYSIWLIFSVGAQDNVVVSVEGGRYDVDLIERCRTSIYWEEPVSQIRRCTWFYRDDGETRFLPYDEDFADKLEVWRSNAKIVVPMCFREKFSHNCSYRSGVARSKFQL